MAIPENLEDTLMYERKKCHHVLHLILTILFWPWCIVWLWRFLSVTSYNDRMELEQKLKEKQEAQARADEQKKRDDMLFALLAQKHQ